MPSNNTRLAFALATTPGANGSVKMNISGTTASLTWTGAQTSDWDIISHTNWKTSTNPSEKYFDLDNVTFDDTSSASTHNVALNTTVTPASVTVAANTNYTISGAGAIAGIGGLTKSGTGTLTLSTINTYLGPTAVQNGKLILGGFGALPADTALTLGSGTTSGVVDLNGNSATVTNLSTSGTGAANVIGNGGVGQSNLTVSGGNGTFGGSIKDTITSGSQTVALSVTGGTLTLTGTNTYTGPTNVSDGATLQVGDGGTSGSLGNTSFGIDGTLAFNRSDSISVSNSIAGQGSLQQNGAGTIILTADNTYAGASVINAGTIQLGDPSVNGGATGNLGPGPINNNGTLVFNHSVDQQFNQIISGSGKVVQNGLSTLTIGGANTFAGGVTVNQGAVRVITPTGGAAASIGSGPIVVNNGATLVTGVGLSGPLTLAGGTIGATFGTTATSWTTGDVTAAAGTTSTVYTADAQNTAVTSELIFTGTLHGSGNINVLASDVQTNPDGGTGFRLRGAAASDYSGTITLGNAVKGEVQTTVAGPFSPAGTGKIVMTAGTFGGSLTGTYSELNLRNNRPSGDTIFGNDIGIAGTGFVTLNPLNGTAAAPNTDTLGNLMIGDGQILGVNKNGAGTNTVQFQNVTLLGGNATFSPTTFGYGSTGGGIGNLILGPIGESVAGSNIIIDGQSTVFLSGANTYTGTTTVNRGTLQLAASDRIPNGSKLILGDGSTGTVPTFASGGFSDTLGTLAIGFDGGAIDFGAAASTLHFADSNAQSWNGPVTINNWTGGSDHLFFGTSSAALTVAQLSDISFGGHNAGAKISTTGEVFPLPVLLKGDYNQDGHVNGFDIAAAMAALTDLATYQSGLGLSGSELVQIGDLTSDGKVNNLDLQGLLTYLIQGNGSVAAVPEPGTLALLGMGVASLLMIGERKRS